MGSESYSRRSFLLASGQLVAAGVVATVVGCATDGARGGAMAPLASGDSASTADGGYVSRPKPGVDATYAPAEM